VVFAVLTWWFTTGIILYLDSLPRRSFRISMAGATLVLLGAIVGLHAGSQAASVSGSYVSFTCAILIWGWLEMSFLMGFITGPRKHACAQNCKGFAHFLHATGAIIYNELMTLAAAVMVWALSSPGTNKTGLWTFGVLWSMRLSAKLNLFLGVTNTGAKLLPPHLRYLQSFFGKRRLNPLFPLSVSAGSAATVMLVQQALRAKLDFEIIGLALVASLTLLATLEHWFMVLPWDTERLWTWMRHPARRSSLFKSKLEAEA
jgi:putative photosynthetic complex assembly protein 2